MLKEQKQIAASTDVIFKITEKIYKLTLEYGITAPRIFNLKRDILLEQCQQTKQKLLCIQDIIDHIQHPPDDLLLSRQILIQNLLLCEQNIQSLLTFKEHDKIIHEKRTINHTLENEILKQDLQRRLQQMLNQSTHTKGEQTTCLTAMTETIQGPNTTTEHPQTCS